MTSKYEMIDVLKPTHATENDEKRDQQVHEMLAALGDNPEAIPSPVRELLEISERVFIRINAVLQLQVHLVRASPQIMVVCQVRACWYALLI